MRRGRNYLLIMALDANARSVWKRRTTKTRSASIIFKTELLFLVLVDCSRVLCYASKNHVVLKRFMNLTIILFVCSNVEIRWRCWPFLITIKDNRYKSFRKTRLEGSR